SPCEAVRSFFLLLLVTGCTDVQRTPEEIVVCAAGDTLQGMDVSTYQGTIDWDQVAAEGIDFAVIRMGDGLGGDAQYARNWSEARRVGVIRSTYQFFRPGTDPIAQADLLVDTMGPLMPDDLPPVIDVEQDDGQSPAVVRDAVSQWLDRIRE